MLLMPCKLVFFGLWFTHASVKSSLAEIFCAVYKSVISHVYLLLSLKNFSFILVGTGEPRINFVFLLEWLNGKLIDNIIALFNLCNMCYHVEKNLLFMN